MFRRFVPAIGVVLAVAGSAISLGPTLGQTNIDQGKPASELFANYCAVCHGKDGRGTGPAAPAMKTSPSDLTSLAKNHSREYPATQVAAVIRGQATASSRRQPEDGQDL